MKVEYFVKPCLKHGETEHRYVKRKGTKKLREQCCKCASESVVKRRSALKLKAVEYKGGKCQKCSYNKCVNALEFHHINPNDKDFSVSESGACRSWEKIKGEIDKCIMVCANCHREIHEGLIDC